MTIEIYKDVVGYEGLYQVSNLGNVKRLYKNNFNFHILKPFDNGTGYLQLGLYKNKKRKFYLLHRLIAEAFINNPYNYPIINHINGVKSDNRIENLEWCTAKHNTNHAFKTGLHFIPKGEMHKLSRKIINIQTGEIYNSSLNLSIELGIKRATLCSWLSNRCKNKTNYRWL